jgi:hypothetical protein
MIQITHHSDDTLDLFVVAVDDQHPWDLTVFNQRLNQGASAPVSVQEDGNGKFSITTTATDANDPTRSKED